MTMAEFRTCVINCMRALFPHNNEIGFSLPAAGDQNGGSALSLALTYDLGIPGERHASRVIRGAPKMIQQLKKLHPETAISVESVYQTRQLLFDLTVTDGWKLLLACESEVHAQHGAGHGLDAEEDGYAWDFRKLLLAPAEKLLFVARVSKSGQGKPPRSIAGLKTSLEKCLSEMPIPAGRSLYVLILPGGQTQVKDAEIGRGLESELTWEPLIQRPV